MKPFLIIGLAALASFVRANLTDEQRDAAAKDGRALVAKTYIGNGDLKLGGSACPLIVLPNVPAYNGYVNQSILLNGVNNSNDAQTYRQLFYDAVKQAVAVLEPPTQPAPKSNADNVPALGRNVDNARTGTPSTKPQDSPSNEVKDRITQYIVNFCWACNSNAPAGLQQEADFFGDKTNHDSIVNAIAKVHAEWPVRAFTIRSIDPVRNPGQELWLVTVKLDYQLQNAHETSWGTVADTISLETPDSIDKGAFIMGFQQKILEHHSTKP